MPSSTTNSGGWLAARAMARQLLQPGVGIGAQLCNHALVHAALGQLQKVLAGHPLHRDARGLGQRQHVGGLAGRKRAFHQEKPPHLPGMGAQRFQDGVDAVHQPLGAGGPALLARRRATPLPCGGGRPVPGHQSTVTGTRSVFC